MTVTDAKEQYTALGGSIFGSPRSFPFSIFRTKYHNKEAINAFKRVTHDYDASLDEVHGFANAPFNKPNFGVCKTYGCFTSLEGTTSNYSLQDRYGTWGAM
jgi:hypothetical protein